MREGVGSGAGFRGAVRSGVKSGGGVRRGVHNFGKCAEQRTSRGSVSASVEGSISNTKEFMLSMEPQLPLHPQLEVCSKAQFEKPAAAAASLHLGYSLFAETEATRTKAKQRLHMGKQSKTEMI